MHSREPLNGKFAAEFHTSGAGLTWIASVFLMGIVVFELSWGLLGDMFGRKKLLYAGAAVSLSALMCWPRWRRPPK